MNKRLTKGHIEKRWVKLGDEIMVDANDVSAAYRQGDRFIIRIGGMGIIDLHQRRLYEGIEASIDKIFKAK